MSQKPVLSSTKWPPAWVDAVATTEAITEQEFKRKATWPGVVARNPGYVFDIGDSQYVASKIDDKEMFQRTITQRQGIRLPALVQPRRPHKDDVHCFELFKCL